MAQTIENGAGGLTPLVAGGGESVVEREEWGIQAGVGDRVV